MDELRAAAQSPVVSKERRRDGDSRKSSATTGTLRLPANFDDRLNPCPFPGHEDSESTRCGALTNGPGQRVRGNVGGRILQREHTMALWLMIALGVVIIAVLITVIWRRRSSVTTLHIDH
jgi:hypothetical protein